MDHHDFRNREIIKQNSLIKMGDVAVDVGANIGTYTSIFLENLGATGKIYAIELVAKTAEALRVRFGNYSNVTFVCGAASDHNGMEQVYLGGTHEQHNTLGHTPDGKPSTHIGEVGCFTLDELLKDEEQISFIKIDVEGSELKVLRGMKETVKKTKTILLENHYDEDWPKIRKILLEDFALEGYNIETEEMITADSPRPYQCLLTKRKV